MKKQMIWYSYDIYSPENVQYTFYRIIYNDVRL